MSKSRNDARRRAAKNTRFEDEEAGYQRAAQERREHRKDKHLKRALHTRDIDYLAQEDEED